MTESAHRDNKKAIEKLKNENADFKKRIKVLQKENASLREKLSDRKEKPPVTKEEKKPIKLFKKEKKTELPDSTKEPKESVVSKEMNLEIPSDFETPSVPLSSTHKIIIEGDSRRMCPSCDNAQHRLIYEQTDKTHILLDYPRIYGKKFKCGNCGTEWRVPVALE
jgi:hypothetical protein